MSNTGQVEALIPPHQRTRRRSMRSVQFSLGLLVSIAACVWLFRSMNGEEIFMRVTEVRPLYLLLAVALTVLSYVLRSWRWPFFFEQPGMTLSQSFNCVIVGFFMNNVLPARMGELVRAHLGGKAVGKSRATVLATIAGERLIDGLTISFLFALLFSIGASAQAQEESKVLFFVAYGFALATLGVAVFLINRRLVFKILDSFYTRGGGLSQYALSRARRFVEGLEPMFRRDRIFLLTVSSLLVWLVELFVYALVAKAFNVDLSIANVSLFFAAVNFSSLIPAAPGGIGVIEAFATAALVHVGVDRETAFAMVASQHLIQILTVGLPGSFLFFSRLHGKLPLPGHHDGHGHGNGH